MPGPVPKRSEERRRRNSTGETTRAPSGRSSNVRVPAPPPKHQVRCNACNGRGVVKDIGDCPACDGRGEKDVNLHPVALSWYRSLKSSGESRFYEPSDWQMARYLAFEMSRSLYQRQSAETVRAILAGMTELLVSEGARRRARLELERGKPAEGLAPVSVLDDYRDALGG
jgi:hypothetical protein